MKYDECFRRLLSLLFTLIALQFYCPSYKQLLPHYSSIVLLFLQRANPVFPQNSIANLHQPDRKKKACSRAAVQTYKLIHTYGSARSIELNGAQKARLALLSRPIVIGKTQYTSSHPFRSYFNSFHSISSTPE